MSGPARIGAFVAVLAVLFGGAYALGGVFGGDEEEHGGGGGEHATHQPGATTPQVAEEIGGSHGEAARGPGATDAHELELELATASLPAGRENELAFRVLDAGGDPVRRFEVEHTKQLHLIVVDKDLERFHHVHPRAQGDEWQVTLPAAPAGDYRVIADVKHDGRKLALTADLAIEGDRPAPAQPAEDAELVEQPLRSGAPVTLRFEAPGETEPYLGAAGHLVVLSEGDLEYVHVHPDEDELSFVTAFPRPGRYVLFLEYRRDGEVRLSRFPVTVS